MIPDIFVPGEAEPSAVLFLANHLGESLENDQKRRARIMAEDLGMLVVAYERPGTGSQSRSFNIGLNGHDLQPDNYAAVAAQTGKILEAAVPESLKSLPRVFFGNSAGSVDAAAVTRTETVGVDYLAIGDPSGMQRMGGLLFGLRWLKQHHAEKKTPKANNDGEFTLTTKDMITRAIPEVIRYQKIWRSAQTYFNLLEIATKKEYGEIAVNVAIFTQGFTMSPQKALRAVKLLNILPPQNRPAPFKAYLSPDRHSFFNDPKNRAEFIRETLALEKAAA